MNSLSKWAEEIAWSVLLVALMIVLLFFTPLQSVKYSSDAMVIANVIALPTSLILLQYVLKGRLYNREKQALVLATILGVSVVCIVGLYYLFIILYSLYWGFLLLILAVSGLRLLKDRKANSDKQSGHHLRSLSLTFPPIFLIFFDHF